MQVEQANVLVRYNLRDSPHSMSSSSRGEFGSILSQFIKDVDRIPSILESLWLISRGSLDDNGIGGRNAPS